MSRVMVAFTYLHDLDAEFDHSLTRMKEWDLRYGSQHLDHGAWKCAIGGTNIAAQRNKVVRQFLTTDCDWLLFVDTDETFDPDLVERLVASADPTERPIMSGLVMAYRPALPVPVTPACNLMLEDGRTVAPLNIPADNPWRVAGVGAGCLLVHRTVYEQLAADQPDTPAPWFQTVPYMRTDSDGRQVPDEMGEDYVFSLRATGAGFPLYVDTDIRCGHRKTYEFTTADFWAQIPLEEIEPRTYVIVPVKDQRRLTESLLNQLARQGGFHGVIVLDNGSGRETRRYLDRQTIAEVIPADGLGIHHMWNMGIKVALSRWPRCNLAILNNDLDLGPDFLTGLASELRSRDDLVAVSPNYDGRTLDGMQDQTEICANRYDGTGGAPGFAFMVKSELFSVAGYSFPEDAMWWFGDNDMMQFIRMTGGSWAITPNVTVEHVGGGGQTGHWDAYTQTDQFNIDRDAFLARWTA